LLSNTASLLTSNSIDFSDERNIIEFTCYETTYWSKGVMMRRVSVTVEKGAFTVTLNHFINSYTKVSESLKEARFSGR